MREEILFRNEVEMKWNQKMIFFTLPQYFNDICFRNKESVSQLTWQRS